ncbi:MAG: DUF3352 domain-containing protein [Anaerolineae bacterium]|nr:DUF3352 domain-containing protein [Anaerolineae bacterium]CAG0988205.1 hypothetical protein ANRL4_02299 [Anaerolineae bacterium]
MTKRLLLTLLLCLILIAPSSALQAISIPQGPSSVPTQHEAETSLARFFPQDTFVFVSLRTDLEHLNGLGGVITKLISKLPNAPAQLPPLPTLLQGALGQMGIDFQGEVLSWLGQRAALGVGNLKALLPENPNAAPLTPDQMPLLLAFEVTDKAKAEAFVDKLLKIAAPRIEVTKNAGEVTTWEAPGLPIKVQLDSSSLLIGTGAGLAGALTRESKLNTYPRFQNTVGLLPAPDYNVLVYLDTPQLLQLQGMLGSNPNVDLSIVFALAQMGPLVLGGTILDERSLTLDIVQAVSKEAQDQFKLSGSKPINLDLAKTMPMGTSLLLQAADMPGLIRASLGLAGAMLATRGQNPDLLADQWKRALEGVKASSGLDLEAEIINALDSDFAMFVGYKPGEVGTSPFMGTIDPSAKIDMSMLSAGFVAQINDTAKGEALLQRLITYLKQAAEDNPELEIGEMDVSGAKLTLVKVSSPTYEAPIEIIVGYSNNIFLIATAQMLSVSGQVGDTPQYSEASAYFLPNPTTLWFMDSNGLTLFMDMQAALGIATARVFRNISRNLMSTPSPSDQNELAIDIAAHKEAQAATRPLAEAISSGSITTASSPTGDAMIRLVLTLNK